MNRDQRSRILRAAQERRVLDVRAELDVLSFAEVKDLRESARILYAVADRESDFRNAFIQEFRWCAWQLRDGMDG